MECINEIEKMTLYVLHKEDKILNNESPRVFQEVMGVFIYVIISRKN